jgi:hypothetical protein
MMTFVEYLINLTVYELLILGCSAPVIALLFRLSESLAKGSAGYVRGIAEISGFVWFFGGLWIAHNASRRHVFGGEGFFEAIRSAFAEGRLIVSFLPVVGRLFPVRSRKGFPFGQPDDPRFG